MSEKDDDPIVRYSSDCALCRNSRRSGDPSNPHDECRWCESVRRRYGSYFYPVRKKQQEFWDRNEREAKLRDVDSQVTRFLNQFPADKHEEILHYALDHVVPKIKALKTLKG